MSSSLSTGPRCPGLRPCPFPCWPPSWHLRLRRPLIGQCWPGPGPWLAHTKWHLTGEHWPLSEERRGTKGYFYYTHEHEKSHHYLVNRYKWVLSLCNLLSTYEYSISKKIFSQSKDKIRDKNTVDNNIEVRFPHLRVSSRTRRTQKRKANWSKQTEEF